MATLRPAPSRADDGASANVAGASDQVEIDYSCRRNPTTTPTKTTPAVNPKTI
ncbi:MAG: hypothetical protein MAG451_00564 [Anaerolineales bacterium]|nr:hypothetical protein [Anaerolineales bacterium]